MLTHREFTGVEGFAPCPPGMATLLSGGSEERDALDQYNGLPEKFGPYVLTRLIGQGGMAEVFEARRIGRHGIATPVAVKRLLPRTRKDEHAVQMFIREAALYARLSHPGLLQIHDFDEILGRYFIAMEYVDGCDLGDFLGFMRYLDQPIPPTVILDVLKQVVNALAYAHQLADDDGHPLHLIHRDIKPSNILLSRQGQVKLADFGLARVDDALAQSESKNHVKGTLRYMSPEHVTLKRLSPSSDLYSVGILLYEMLTLEPYVAPDSSIEEVVHTIAVQPVDKVVAAVPTEFEIFATILRNALERQEISRYARAQEMLDDLHALEPWLPPGPDMGQFLSNHWKAYRVYQRRLSHQ